MDNDDLRPSAGEEEYFKREDIEKLRRLARERRRRLAEAEKEQLRRRHWMRCPKCGDELHSVFYHGLEVNRCFSCNGTWLDQDELRKLAGRNGRKVVDAVLNIFR